jgi:hypothetical protein
MDSHVPWLLRLPHELLLLILSYNNRAGWKRARQTCRGLDKLAASLLFSRVYFELCGHGCESLYNISQHPTLGLLVKTAVPRRVRGYRKFASIDDWAASTHQPGAPDSGLFSARETHYYDNQELSDSLMPYDDWVAMSAEQKQALYEAYNTDHEQQEEEIRDIVSTLCFRATTTSTMKFIHPDRALDMGTANVAVRQLNKALKTLPNLSALEHEPGFLYDEQWALRWRDLYFHPYSILGNSTYEEDEDVEALQLSVILQSLACFRARDHRLKKMSLYVGGPAFATPERLQHLWDGQGHELTRLCRQLRRNSSGAAADLEAYANDATPADSKLYRGELEVMRFAFASLTHLKYRVSEEEEPDGCIAIAAKLAFEFLSTARNLQKISLAIGRLVDGILLPVYGADERQYATGSILLLRNSALHAPWSQIRNIELEIATDRTTLVSFLLAHRNTLRLLTLTRTSIVRLGDPRNTWEPTLTEIGQGLCLDSLTLANLTDTLEKWAPGVQPRMLFDKEDKRWEDKASDYEAYYYDRVHRILQGEEIHSLNPPLHLPLKTPQMDAEQHQSNVQLEA